MIEKCPLCEKAETMPFGHFGELGTGLCCATRDAVNTPRGAEGRRRYEAMKRLKDGLDDARWQAVRAYAESLMRRQEAERGSR